MSEEPESEHSDPSHVLARLLRALATEADAQTETAVGLPPAPTVARYYEATFLDLPGSGAELKVVSVPHTPDSIAESVLRVRDYNADYIPPPGFLREFRTSFSFQPPRLIEAILATRPD